MIGDHTKPQQRLVAAYVWRRWADGYDSHLPGMAAAAGLSGVGRQISDIVWRLVHDGVLQKRPSRVLRNVGYVPGPCFGGLDKAGRAYTVIA